VNPAAYLLARCRPWIMHDRLSVPHERNAHACTSTTSTRWWMWIGGGGCPINCSITQLRLREPLQKNRAFHVQFWLGWREGPICAAAPAPPNHRILIWLGNA
jgi:hypothetical protein